MTLLVPAPGIDGELPAATVGERLAAFCAERLAVLDAAAFASVGRVFDWHPSEASGLLAAAAEGARGAVETRDAGCRIELTDDTAAVYALDAHQAAARSPASVLANTTTWAEAREITLRLTGISEIDYETRKARRLRAEPSRIPTIDDLPVVDCHAHDAAARGADYVTVRRLAGLIGVTGWEGLSRFRELLTQARATRYRQAIYLVTSS